MMSRKFLRFATPCAALAFALGAPACGGEKDVEFKLVAPDTDQTNLDGGKKGTSQGDQFVFSGPLNKEDGTNVGRIDGLCSLTSTPKNRQQVRRQCVVTTTIKKKSLEGRLGEIYTQGVGRVPAEDVILGVTGGNDDFQKARGQATFDYRQKDRVVISYDLKL